MATTAPSTAAAELVRRNEHVMGPAAASWTPEQTVAWMGLLGTHRQLTRGFAKAVEDRTGLSPTALGLLGRLHQDEDGRMRISGLSEDIGLSLSRTSRVLDALEQRQLVARVQCPEDARATNAVLTDAGRAIIRDAQDASSAWVHEHFFAHVSEDELAVLAGVFERFTVASLTPCEAAAGSAAAECPGAESPCDAASADPCGGAGAFGAGAGDG